MQQIIYPLDNSVREGSGNQDVPLPALSLSAWTNLTGRPAGSSDSQDAAHPATMTDPGLFATAPGSSSLDPLNLQQDSDSDRIVAMDFCEHSRFLSLVLGDGSVALCVASQDGSSPLRELSLARWVCGAGSGACIARIGATAQLLAVGKFDGVVDLYRWVLSGARADLGMGLRCSEQRMRTGMMNSVARFLGIQNKYANSAGHTHQAATRCKTCIPTACRLRH